MYVSGALRHSLQDRLSKGAAGRGRADEIYLKLQTSTGIFIALLSKYKVNLIPNWIILSTEWKVSQSFMLIILECHSLR